MHFVDGGYSISADQLTYEQKTGSLIATGHVVMHSPNGEVYNAASVEVNGPLKTAFIQSLTVTTAEGARVTADDVHYGDALQTILTNAAYSPCGLCIDKQGQQDRLGGEGRAHDLRSAKCLGDARSAIIVAARYPGRLAAVVLDSRPEPAARHGIAHALDRRRRPARRHG